MHTGWKTIRGTKFYFSPSSGRAYKGRTYTINGKKYRFSSGGQLIITTTKPEVPSKPETPSTEAPSKPETPSTETPSKPETPSTEAPSKPEIPSTETPSKPETPSTEKKQKYTYSIERYNPNGYGLYNKTRCVLYVKTDAPKDEFYLSLDGGEDGNAFYDVKYPKTSTGSNIIGSKIKYKDGYLIPVVFNSGGHKSVTPIEYGNDQFNHVKCKETFYFDVLDYDSHEEAYLRSVINKVTNINMSDLEKIQKIKEYLFINYKYADMNTTTRTPCYSINECGAYL